MATESRVTTEGSHPFSTGLDLCLVHNGSLSNHNRLREQLRREGIEFQTENDTEVAAGYLTWRLREGASLEQALEGCLDDLDGFYTFLVGTADGFAVLRDPIACKPAVLAETDDWVAMALRVPRDRRAARAPPTRGCGSRSPRVVYAWEKALVVMAVADVPTRRGRRPRDDAAARAEPAAARPRPRRRRPAPLAGRSTRTARTRSRAGSTPTIEVEIDGPRRLLLRRA